MRTDTHLLHKDIQNETTLPKRNSNGQRLGSGNFNGGVLGSSAHCRAVSEIQGSFIGTYSGTQYPAATYMF